MRQQLLDRRLALPATALICTIWIMAVSLHEFGHAIVAYWAGDRSMKTKGYLTLNPFKYIHPLTSIILPGFYFLLGDFPLPGAAVYIEHEQFRSRWWRSLVYAAGPLASFLSALGLVGILRIVTIWQFPTWVVSSLIFFIALQLLFTLINLLPIPILDGYGILEPWLPQKLKAGQSTLRLVGLFILLILPLLLFIPNFREGFIAVVSLPAFQLLEWLGISSDAVDSGRHLFDRGYCALFIVTIGIVALLLHPQEFWKYLAFLLNELKKYQSALIYFDRAIRLEANDSNAWGQRGRALLKLDRYEEALVSFKRAIELDPSYGWAWGQQGWILGELNRYEEALVSFERATEIDPEYRWAWNKRGWILGQLNRYEEALVSFERATELDSKDGWAWGHHGSILLELNRYEEALASFERATELAPKNGWGWGKYGVILCKLNFYEEALVSFKKATELDPKDEWAWRQHGRILVKLNRHKEALASFERAADLGRMDG
jgi:tetratricopeptide (TPR) repeat protein